ncbi:uncharacterized protein LOC108142901 [Drosophila elegans]|uniref:uncharacterized protein LOC108142901 n=1 Tax=Drosophila elegans TaxID=30023 RepID=UPI0007E86107|nr:uncharacterized protein LOC108142901 [Drosophila elegans]
MSSDRRYYFGADLEDNEGAICKDSATNNNTNNTEAEADKDDHDADDSEFLQDVPYSSSSIDRSSVGSIPWADDAIKKNLLDWERVERLMSGEDPLLLQEEELQEPELRNEIADWQRKFPCLLGRRTQHLNSFDSQTRDDIDSISNLSLNSLEDEDDEEAEDGFLTPKAEEPRSYLRPSQKKLVDLLDRDLRVTSVSVKLLKRQRSHHQPPILPISSATNHQQSSARLRMPPILNVLDTNRRFRGLLNNRSFVQLTQVQQKEQLHQAKSAVLPHQGHHRSSAWHMPMAANRFFSNRNAVVLPSLNLGRHGRDLLATANNTATATSSQSNSSGGGGHNSNSSSSNRSTMHRHTHMHPFGATSVVSSNTHTPSTGRSISAAVHHPRSEFAPSSAFYIPYSASKFKAFK